MTAHTKHCSTRYQFQTNGSNSFKPARNQYNIINTLGKVVPVQRVIKFSGSPTTDTMYKQAKTTHKQATYGLEPAATRSPASLVPIYQLVPVYLSHPIIIKMD
jgi:hypothetical protein